VDEPIPLDVFADIACPWCFIGHRRLAAALAGVAAGTFALRHRSFELQPNLPPQGVPMREYAEARFGSAERLAALREHVTASAERSGLTLAFEAMAKAPNTRLAHRAVALAREQDFEAPALDALYLAHFSEGLDVTDPEVVVARLERAGLPDPGALRAGLADGAGELQVEEDETIGAQIRVSGVPVVVAGRRIGFQGAQDPEVYARFLADAPDRLAALRDGAADATDA